MAEPSKHINYSFEDIQRYLQGKMSAAEMHAIEKAALQDPFLADAIEGFTEADFSSAKQHLNEINAGLFGEKKESKVVTFNKRTQWLNVAAVIIVLAGIGVVASYFLKTTSSSNQQTEIAKVQREPAKKENDSVAAMANSNVLKKEDTGSFIAQNKTAKKTQLSVPKRKDEEEIIIAENKARKQNKANAYKADDTNKYTPEVAAIAAAPPANEKNMMSRSFGVADTPTQLQGKVSGIPVLPSPATFSGKIVDENNEPIPYATIESTDKKTIVATDVNGFFHIQQKDTMLNVTASTIGFNSRNIALKRGMNNPIVLQRAANSGLDEVAVTTVGVQKKSRPDSATPVGGWYNFNHYVMNEIEEDSTFINNMSEDDLVELEFLVDTAGNPYNIKVIKPLDKQRNAKAVELLKNGPKWTSPSKKKKAKVVINF